MQAAFHYIVKAKLIRQTKANEFDFVEINKKFENKNPIIAREEAINHYQSYIDNLLQYKNKTYISDKQARSNLVSFIEPGVVTTLKFGTSEIEFTNDSFGNGIGVYFVADENSGIYEFEIGDEILIHGIGNIGGSSIYDNIFFNLLYELQYYKHYNYETKYQEIKVTYCVKDAWLDGCENTAIITSEILKTPFDWSAYDKPFWWQRQQEQGKESQREVKTFEEIIEEGEGNQVEFKQTLLYNLSEGKDKNVAKKIAKVICGFLNSNGGFLFIGVNDKRQIQGLENDFSLANGKNPKDFFQLEFDEMIKHFLSFSIKSNIIGKFYESEEKEIFIVTVSPSKHRPIFLQGQNGKEFYVRGEASTRQLRDIEEIANYCINKWTN